MNNIFLKANCNSLILLSQVLYLMFCFTAKKAIATEVVSTVIASNVNREPKIKKPKLGDRGIPTGRRRGGTSRSDCPVSETPLTAIIPQPENDKIERTNLSQEKTSDSKLFLAQTVAEYPTFWVYVPQISKTNQIGEFILQDEQDRDIYRSVVDLPEKAGIINLELPKRSHPLQSLQWGESPQYAKRYHGVEHGRQTRPFTPPLGQANSQNALKIGQKYHWYLKVYCGDKREDSGYLYVDAWIERVKLAPKIQAKLDTAKVNRHQILIDRNLWYDAIDNLARIQQVNGATDDWRKLLTSLGLSDLIGRDILGRVIFRENNDAP